MSADKIIAKEVLHFLKASQFGLVYTLNIAFVFSVLGSGLSSILINSGDIFINFLNFWIKQLNIPPGDYSGSYSLKKTFWYAYLALSLIIYLLEKWWQKRFDKPIIFSTKSKLIAIPIIISLGYSFVIYFFYLEGILISNLISFFSILTIITIIANYYYLLVSYAFNYLNIKLELE